MDQIIPVILCGGSGTRLWPLSRENKPKQFLKLLGDQSLLQQTALRALDVLKAQSSRLVVVTQEGMAPEAAGQLREIFPAEDFYMLQEPEARNTSAAIAFAAAFVMERFGSNDHLWILPADHRIANREELHQAVSCALEVSEEEYLVTFGIKPSRPETGYGYIRKSRPLSGFDAHLVERFYEKPDSRLAGKFIKDGYLWNSGMHFFKAKTIMESFCESAPETWKAVYKAVKANPHKPQKEVYAGIKNEPFEKAILEKSDRVAVVPCNLDWSDIGSWQSLWEVMNKDVNGNAGRGSFRCEETRNSLIIAQDRLVACVGLEDAVVIETGDAVLVAAKNCGDGLKNLVGNLRGTKTKETLKHLTEECSWGVCRQILESPALSVRECRVAKNQSIKNQTGKHAFNPGFSHWLIAEGRAAFHTDGQTRNLEKDEVISLPSYKSWEIVNTGMDFLKIYEIHFSKGSNSLLMSQNNFFEQHGITRQVAA